MPSLNRETRQLKTLGTGAEDYVAIPLSFAPNGATTVLVATSFKGFVKTAVRSDTGIYTVTMPCGFPEIVALDLNAQFLTKGGTGTTGQSLEIGAVSATAGTIEVRCMNTGTTTLTEIAADAANRINIIVYASKSKYVK